MLFRSTALLLEDEWKEGDPFPTSGSKNDPDQGWGNNIELMGDISDNMFDKVEDPVHVVFEDKLLKPELDKVEREIDSLDDSIKFFTEFIIENSNNPKYADYIENMTNQLVKNREKIKEFTIKKENLIKKISEL